MKFPGDELLHVFFENKPVTDELESKRLNRLVQMDQEQVTIKAPGDRGMVKVFPATAVWRWVDDPIRGRVPLTYAERFSEQYRQFKAEGTQTVKGTPLSELTFLTRSKQAELRALGVHTAEMLASLAEQNIKNLGMGGRELVEKAKAYLANAESGASVANLAEELARLKDENEKLKAQAATYEDDEMVTLERAAIAGEASRSATPSPFAAWEDDDIKTFIKDATGALPRGNPNHASLVRMADEANAALKKQKTQAA
jgi:hypothetical protein